MPAFESKSMVIIFNLIFKIIHERKDNRVNILLLNLLDNMINDAQSLVIIIKNYKPYRKIICNYYWS